MKRCWRICFVIFFTTLFLGVFTLAFNLYRLFFQPMIKSDVPLITLHINKLTSAASFTHLLESEHLIKTPRLFLLLIRLQGLSQHLKAGIYQVHPGESALQFLARVADGDVLIESFRIIEGMTQVQVAAALIKAPNLIYNKRDWLKVSDHHPNAEGLLFADTYHYKAGSQSEPLLQLAHTNLIEFLEQCWQHRYSGLPYKTSYEMLIAASILEKEAANPEERRLIAGIIVNRIRKNMPLQMDPTVIYGRGPQSVGGLTKSDLHHDTLYNTYRFRGLPPTPIAMVGRDAIDAAAHPKFSDYLYFVAVGDGSHHFSITYEQQKQAITRYRKN